MKHKQLVFQKQIDSLIAQKCASQTNAIRVEPDVFAQYLEKTGWTEYKTKRDCVKVFQREFNDAFFQVTIPMQKTLSDYDEAMQRAIDTVVQVEAKAIKEQQ